MSYTSGRPFAGLLVAAPAFMRGKERFSAPEKSRLRSCALALAMVPWFLNTSESTIEKWETGAKHPSGMALKLLAVVEKHGLEALAYSEYTLAVAAGKTNL
jgi:hypothetical protein